MRIIFGSLVTLRVITTVHYPLSNESEILELTAKSVKDFGISEVLIAAHLDKYMPVCRIIQLILNKIKILIYSKCTLSTVNGQV